MMKRNYLFFILGLFLLAALACTALAGEPTLPAVEPTAVVTPTTRPTLTPDPFADLTPTATAAPPGGIATPTLASAMNGTTGNGSSSGGEVVVPGGSANPTDTGQAGGNEGNGGNGNGNGGSQSGPAAAGCPAAGTNLLRQGSFEGPFESFSFVDELNVPPPWIPWFVDDGVINFRPEYKPADGVNFPNRVRSGVSAQVYFKSFGQFQAGLYQQVIGIRPGTRLQFSAYGQGWSCEDFSQCGDGSSHNPANMFMRIGIDPHGNSRQGSRQIIWSDYFNPIDRWEHRCVETIAQHDVVTVFLWASPDGPRQNQDVYWDDASLVELP